MAGTADELVERILSAAAELSDERIERLVAEARREAEAEVRGLLKNSIKAALLQRALSKLGATELPPSDASPGIEAQTDRFAEQAARETGTGCYVYCIALGDRLTFSEPVRGVDDSAELSLVRHRDVQAVTSQVALAEFGKAALADRVSDPQWLEQKARAHDQLLKAAQASGPIIPFRFCTIVRSEDDIRQVLERHSDRIRETLAGLTGKKEWGVKVMLRESSPPRNDNPSGRWYLERKQNAARKEAENRQQAQQRARECHEQLATAAEKSMLLPASNRAGDRAVLNAAYLVGDANERKFHALIAAMDERLEPDGLTLEVTGPWPPYNFVNLDLSLPTAP